MLLDTCSLLSLLRGKRATHTTTDNMTSSFKDLPPSVSLLTMETTKSTKSKIPYFSTV